MADKMSLFHMWIEMTMKYAYNAESMAAKEKLLLDIDDKSCYWFSSEDLDKMMPKFIDKVLEETK